MGYRIIDRLTYLVFADKKTQAEKWAEHVVGLWEEEIDRLTQEGAEQWRIDRAVRTLHAAEHQLELAIAGAWPDGDRAARSFADTPTRPG